MSRTRFVFLSLSPGKTVSYLTVDEDGEILERGTLPAGDGLAPAKTILAIEGPDVVTRWLELPTANVAREDLKDDIASPMEDVHIAIGAAEPDGFRPVCIVARAVLESYLDRAAALGIEPDAVVPAALMLQAPEGEAVHALVSGDHVIVRGRHLAFAMEPELAWLLVGSLPVRAIEGDEEHILARGALSGAIDLLQGKFARKRKGAITIKSFKRAASLAAALLLSPFLLWGAEIAAAHSGARQLELRAEETARALPGAASSRNAVAHAQKRLAEIKSNDRFLLATSLLFAAVEETGSVELDSYSYQDAGVIRATLVHAGAPEIENLVRVLEQSGIAAIQEPATDRNGLPAVAITLRPLP